MGLDMYLNKHTYVGVGAGPALSITGLPEDRPIQGGRVKYIVEEVGYWRKANQVHGWFLRNVLGGDEDGWQGTCVSKDTLEELLNLCQHVLGTRKDAPKLLPIQAGFFFGSDAYDDGYFDDLELTVRILQPLVYDDCDDYAHYEYQASW